MRLKRHPSPAVQTAPSPPVEVLEAALEQSHEVRLKVEACAEHLSTANGDALQRMAKGATKLPATQVLQTGLAAESTMEEVSGDLRDVTHHLSQGVDEAKAVQAALTRSRADLAESEHALAVSRHAERHASQRAMHDPKTGLPNRSLFDDRLAQAIAGAERHDWQLAVMFLDLDGFKLVNDNHGHAAGDAVLEVVARRLTSHAREEDTVCRNGGDEFLYLLINPGTREDVLRIAGLVRAAIAQPMNVEGQRFVVTPSIGVALYPEHGDSPRSLVAHADAAMYRAKKLRSPCELYVAASPPSPAAA